MISWFYSVFVIVCIGRLGSAVELYLGDACVLESTGEAGMCDSLKDCMPARLGLGLGRRPQDCIYEGSVPVVCCVYPRATVTPPTTSTTLRPFRRASQQCPPLPAEAVKVKKTGQKAWDKCIDLADSVYPCIPSSFSLNSKLIRSHQCAHTATTLIVGGLATAAGEFPHMAALGVVDSASPFNITWHCGGSLISDQWVLTAGHCLSKGVGSPVSHVRLGGGDNNDPPIAENLFSVIQAVMHPGYARPAKYNDIALLKLHRKVIFSKEIRPACLHTGEPVNDDKALVSGWGATTAHGAASNSLLKTTVEKFNFIDCDESNPPIKAVFRLGVQDETQICYGHKTLKQDTCQGDSGGPLQIYNNDRVDCTYIIIGITSTGQICGEPGIPAIYTRVSAYIPWIEETVWPDD